MRIIAGKYKKSKIYTIEGLSTRPVMDRIKETIFNILVHRFSIIDTEVLDLYAGSGSLGLEALSRGAKNITFVEKSKEAVDILKKNIEKLNCKEQCIVKHSSVELFLENAIGKYNLIFCDPPFSITDPTYILNMILQKDIVFDDSIIIFRTEEKNTFNFDKYDVLIEKNIGRSKIYFLRKK